MTKEKTGFMSSIKKMRSERKLSLLKIEPSLMPPFFLSSTVWPLAPPVCVYMGMPRFNLR